MSESHAALCRHCRRAVDAADAYCRYCGARQAPRDSLVYHPLVILVLAVTVLGPFALPLVFVSPQMTRGAKTGMSVVIVAYTGVVLYLTWVIVAAILGRWQEIARTGSQLWP